MATAGESIGKTFELLLEIASHGAEKTWDKIKATAPAYTKSLAITAVLWIITTCGFIILEAETGHPVFGYFAAIFAVIFTAVLGFLWTPLGIIIGMAHGETANPIKGGEHYLKSFGTLYIMVIMASICIVNTDFSNNPDGVPTLFLAAAAVVLSSALGARLFSEKFYAVVSATVLVLTLLSFRLPNMFNRISEGIKSFDGQFQKTASADKIFYLEDGRYSLHVKDVIRVPLKAGQWEKVYVPGGLFSLSPYGTPDIPDVWVDLKIYGGLFVRVKKDGYYFSLDKGKTWEGWLTNNVLHSDGEYIEIQSNKDYLALITPIRQEY